MPNIVELNAPLGANVRPDESAASVAREAGMVEARNARVSGSALGRGVSGFGPVLQKMADEAERHTTFEQISHGASLYSSLYGDLTQQWTKLATQSDPNDTSVMQGFREKILDPSLAKFQQGFEAGTPDAQRWALSRANELSSHFTTKMVADMGTRAGLAVHKNLGDLERNYSNVVATDPSALEHIVSSLHTDIKALVSSSPNMTPVEAARVTDEMLPAIEKKIAVSAGYSMGQQNPQALINEINKGTYDKYLDGHEKLQAIKFAEGVRKGQQADEQHAYELAQRKKRDIAIAAQDEYVSGILRGQGANAAKVAADPRLTPGERENIVNFQHSYTMQVRERKETTPHPETYRTVMDQMLITARDDPNNIGRVLNRVRDEFIKGNLNPQEEATLEARYAAIDKPMERNFNSQIAHVQHSLTSNAALAATFAADPSKLSTTVNQIEHDAHAKLDAARSKGEDLNPLLDPTSPKYLFSRGVIQSYLTPPREAISAQAAAVRAREGKVGGPASTGAPTAVTKGRDAVKAGEQYLAPDGSVRVKGGG